jgi:hypothetical protein
MVVTRCVPRSALALLGGLGCGPSVALPESGSNTSAETTSAPVATGGSTGTLDGSTSVGTGSSSGSGSGGSGSSSTGDGGTLGGTSTGEPVAPVTYCIDQWGSGYERTRIWRRDETADLCALVRLVRYGPHYDGPQLDVPEAWAEAWAVEYISLYDDVALCGGAPGQDVIPSAAEGTVELVGDPLAPFPELAGIDATLYFGPVQPWIPEQVVMQIGPLPVEPSCDDGYGRWVPGP